MAMLLKYRESTSKSSSMTMTKPPPSDHNTGYPSSSSANKLNILRRGTSSSSLLLVPEPLPPPSANKKNIIGQQKHTVEIRSGGVIAFRVPLYQKMMVGGLSGVIGLTTVFPVDLIKTRLQLLSSSGGSSSATIGISTVCRDVLAKHGMAGFYRGLIPTAIMVAPEKAIKLGVNDYLRDVFCNFDRTKETVPQQVAAGALTGVVQVAVTNPMEILKIRLQMADSTLTPIMAVRELGVRGLYTGSAVTMLRDVPYNIIFFLTYIQLKRALTSPEGEVSRERILGSGVAAGMVAALVGTPMDVVKSRIQMRNSPYTNGALDCAQRLYGEGGSSIFFRGAVPRMAVQGPLYGIALLLFELQSQYLSSASSR